MSSERPRAPLATPSVAVIIPSYNRAATLDRALGSLAVQTVAPEQIILVDDASVDETLEVARAWVDRLPLEILALPANRGPSAARNHGIACARADWIVFLDSDDALKPDCLEVVTAHICNQANDAVVVAGGAEIVAEDGRPRRLPMPQPDHLRSALLDHNPIQINGLCVRRAALQQVGGFDETLISGEDWDLWLRLAQLGPLVATPAILATVYVGHSGRIGSRFRARLMGDLAVRRRWLRQRQATDRQSRNTFRFRIGSHLMRMGRPKLARPLLVAAWCARPTSPKRLIALMMAVMGLGPRAYLWVETQAQRWL